MRPSSRDHLAEYLVRVAQTQQQGSSTTQLHEKVSSEPGLPNRWQFAKGVRSRIGKKAVLTFRIP